MSHQKRKHPQLPQKHQCAAGRESSSSQIHWPTEDTNQCIQPSIPQGTPKPQFVSIFEKSSLKRGVQHEEDQQRWFKIQQVFGSKRSNCHTEEPMDKSGDEQELMDELLDLCSWWSDTEQGSVQRHCQQQQVQEEPEEADTPLFQEFANYLTKLSKEVDPVKSRKEAHREVLMPLLISDSEFDLNASF
uniref:Uncharacterized protein n=1 Tax=Ditylenchus dipsaci TaxID=166011 RepID=A0A915ELS8_9BILA